MCAVRLNEVRNLTLTNGGYSDMTSDARGRQGMPGTSGSVAVAEYAE